MTFYDPSESSDMLSTIPLPMAMEVGTRGSTLSLAEKARNALPASSGRIGSRDCRRTPVRIISTSMTISRMKPASSKSSPGFICRLQNALTSSRCTTPTKRRRGDQFGPDTQQTEEAAYYVDDLVRTGGKAERGSLTDRFVWVFRPRHGDHCRKLDRPRPLHRPFCFSHLKGMLLTRQMRPRPKELTHISRARAINLSSIGDEICQKTCIISTRTIARAIRLRLRPALMRRRRRARDPTDTGAVEETRELTVDPNRLKSMRAIFYAVGPDIRPLTTGATFENVGPILSNR